MLMHNDIYHYDRRAQREANGGGAGTALETLPDNGVALYKLSGSSEKFLSTRTWNEKNISSCRELLLRCNGRCCDLSTSGQ